MNKRERFSIASHLFFSLFVFFISIVEVSAQDQAYFNFQGVALDSSNRYISNKPISIRLSIYESNQIVYRELHRLTTDLFGQFNLLIGKGVVQSGSFLPISWNKGSHSIQVEMDVVGNGVFKISIHRHLRVYPMQSLQIVLK
jgi:hypothetical protein